MEPSKLNVLPLGCVLCEMSAYHALSDCFHFLCCLLFCLFVPAMSQDPFSADFDQIAVAEPADRQQKQAQSGKKKPEKQPRYHVILWDDSYHTYEYVVMMMQKLFRYPWEKGLQIAEEVDSRGRAICMTTTMEHAELKRDQIHAFGKDDLIPRCKGSMSATIEPVE